MSNTLYPQPIVISIDGPIGAGKSTVCLALERMGYDIHTEGVDDQRWGNILNKYYKNNSSSTPGGAPASQVRWAFTLQTAILSDMADQRVDMLAQKTPVVIIERSPLSALTFVDMARESGTLDDNEYALYMRLHRQLAWAPDYVIALFVPPEEGARRVLQRARPAEVTGDGALRVSTKYLARIDALYRRNIARFKQQVGKSISVREVVVMDGRIDPDILAMKIAEHIEVWNGRTTAPRYISR